MLGEGQRLEDKLEACGWDDANEFVVDNTPTLYEEKREKEIGEWLYANCPSTTKFIILDNIAPVHWNYGFQKHLVHIDPDVGLTMKDVRKAIKILKGESNG